MSPSVQQPWSWGMQGRALLSRCAVVAGWCLDYQQHRAGLCVGSYFRTPLGLQRLVVVQAQRSPPKPVAVPPARR